MIGVLLRFRKEPVAFIADIEKMFYQVRVPKEQRSFLRYLWWKDGNLDAPLVEYQMCVHLFGGISSPSTCNFALKQTSTDFETVDGEEASFTLRRNFYVDDCLKSMENTEQAIRLIFKVQGMCKEGGFNLTKIVSNNPLVSNAIPDNSKYEKTKSVEICDEPFVVERALGVTWTLENDTLGFRITLQDKPCTRRGILSTVASVYDPYGMAGPFLLCGKRILQEITLKTVDWDEVVPEGLRQRWEKWRHELVLLRNIEVKSCYKPENFGNIKELSLHSFSYACFEGYGQVTYLRSVNIEGSIHVSFVMAKSRVSPTKVITFPRLELTAATVSSKVSKMIEDELDKNRLHRMHWTDSKIVLGYIRNETTRFRIFVANRIQIIRDHSDPTSWKYVEGISNPADHASRGISISAEKLVYQWFNGPDFLWLAETNWPSHEVDHRILENDSEVIQDSLVNVSVVNERSSFLSQLTDRISCWYRLKLVLAIVMRFCAICRGKFVQTHKEDNKKNLGITTIVKGKLLIDSSNLLAAERVIVRILQKMHFEEELIILRSQAGNPEVPQKIKHQLKGGSSLVKLNPFLDSEGIIPVGGRLEHSLLSYNSKYPVILPKNDVISDLLVRWYHKKVEHGGRSMTLNEIRADGYWIIGGNAKVRPCIHKCVICRRLRGVPLEQKMADLPIERLISAPPFTFSGTDMFGPFQIKQGRSVVKRYACLFTCMNSRAIHLEITHTMDTDSFINALRRFIARRGNVQSIRSDNGSNFVGTVHELKKAWDEMDHGKIHKNLLERGVNWINWKWNTPTASHMGGVWERQIRSVRNVLESMLMKHGYTLDDELLTTLMCEVEAIVNSRSLTVEVLSDPNSCVPLSPVQLLTQRSDVIIPSPGEFIPADIYCRRRWRRIQFLANEFWKRWQKEYLHSLTCRQKWHSTKRNYCINDIVLLKDDTTKRIKWKMGRVVETFPDEKGLVRQVVVVVSRTEDNRVTLKRPISKLVLLHKGKQDD